MPDYSNIPLVNLNRFRQRFNQFRGRTHYAWGVKPPLTSSVLPPPYADCSGWLSLALILCGYPQDMPRSSHEMGDWFIARSSTKPIGEIRDETDPPFYRPHSLADVLRYARHDAGRLFVMGWDKGTDQQGHVIDPNSTNRHILSACAGVTGECAHGLGGVGSRDASVFVDEIDTGDHFRWICELGVDLS